MAGCYDGDLNEDCQVNFLDFVIFAEQWRDAGGCSDANCADLDNSNVVDETDLSRFAWNWLNKGDPLVISEFMASNNTTLADEDGEYPDWIEIYNPGPEAASLNGWALTDNAGNLNKWEFPDGIEMGVGEFLVVFASGKDRTEPGLELHTNFELSGVGEYLALVRPDESIATEYAPQYPQQSADISYGLADGVEEPVFFMSPTPGATNGAGPTELGPRIEDASHTPTEPENNDDIIVTAKITDTMYPVNASSVRLHYRVMFGSTSSITMYDDGAHGDEYAGDDIYGASIPDNTSSPGEMVRWYITAEDSEGTESRWPLFPYPDESDEYLGTVVYDPSIVTNLPVYHWFAEDLSALNKAWSNRGTQTSIYYDGEFYDNVFGRIRGEGAQGWPKKCYKVDFNPGHHFRFDPDEARVEEFNLNSTHVDKSYVRQNLVYETFRDAGDPYCIIFPVRLHLNGEFFSVTLFIEQVDEEYLKRNGLAENGIGALWKAKQNDSHSNEQPLVGTANDHGELPKRTRLNDPLGYTEVQDLIDAVNGLSGNDLNNYIFDNFNIPQIINHLAATFLAGDGDWGQKNFYIYRDTDGTGEWHILPWDKDLSFGRHCCPVLNDDIGFRDNTTGWPWTENRISNAILQSSDAMEMYLRRLQVLMDKFLQPDGTPYGELRYENRIDELIALIGTDADLDYNQWWVPLFDQGQAYGTIQTITEATNILKNDYLAIRRGRPYSGPEIPSAQPASPNIIFSTIEFNPASGNQEEEYIKLNNNESVAVDISGWKIDGGIEYTFKPGTVIPAGKSLYLSPNVNAFRARGTDPNGGDGFFIQGNYRGHLSNWGETLNLFTDEDVLIDTVTYAGNPTDQQRYLRITEMMYHPADAAPGSGYNDEDYEFIELKNVGSSQLELGGTKFTDGIVYNFPGGPVETVIEEFDLTLVNHDHSWKYDRSDTDFGTTWREVGYNDSGWSSGDAILYRETTGLPWPASPWVKNTDFESGYDEMLSTYYFRTHFDLDVDPASADEITLEMNTLLDDGSVIYLNGLEVKRVGMPGGMITHSTNASRVVDNAENETFSISAANLVEGDNVLAVEVHQGGTSELTLITEDAAKKVLVPTGPVSNWNEFGFDDSGWGDGLPIIPGKTGGVGYERSSGYQDYITHDVESEMYNENETCYIRIPFTVNDPGNFDSLTLRIRYDDGFIAHINGTQVWSENAPPSPEWDSGATSTHSDSQAIIFQDIDITAFLSALQAGENVLAIHGLNRHTTSSDFLISVELVANSTQGGIISDDVAFGLTLDADITITTVIPETNSIVLEPGEYIVVAKQPDAFAERYPGVTDVNIIGPYTGSLSNGGEIVKLEDDSNSTILQFEYNDGWYAITDGEGFSLTIVDEMAEPNTWDEKDSWRPSAAIGGSPGADDAGPLHNPGDIVINELLAHSPGASPDWIELHNTTASPINIGGWFISDDGGNLKKYEIATGTSIAANGYIVFNEDDHFGNPGDPGCHVAFALSENGERVYLSSGLGGELTGYSEDEDFGASEQNVSFGRYYKGSTDTFNFVAMSSQTPGSANAYPKVGPVIINEVMYHPAYEDDAEYIELFNISGSLVTLYDFVTSEPWKITDGITFMFPDSPAVTLSAGEYLLLAKDLAIFNSEYPGVSCQKFEWASGSLNNAGEKIELGMPGDVDGGGERQYIRIDRVNYDDESPWPTEPDGDGPSLSRIDPCLYGNDPNNWQSAVASPGTANP